MILVDKADDPATPELRLSLVKLLLVGAIRRYEETMKFTWRVDAGYPRLSVPSHPETDEEVAEHRAWKRLDNEACEDFDSAEQSLALRMLALAEFLGRPADPEGEPGQPFVPLAVRHAGAVYVLSYDPANYEPETNIIAVFREGQVIDLDQPADPG